MKHVSDKVDRIKYSGIMAKWKQNNTTQPAKQETYMTRKHCTNVTNACRTWTPQDRHQKQMVGALACVAVYAH